MQGLANLPDLDIRVWRVCVAPPTATRFGAAGAPNLFAEILPNLPPCWKSSFLFLLFMRSFPFLSFSTKHRKHRPRRSARYGGLCLLHGWPDISNQVRGGKPK